MTTVVVVKKGQQIVIAAETLVTFGDTRLNHRFEDNTKIFKFDTASGPTYIGMAGTVAHFPALRKAINALPKAERLFGSKDEVFDTFTHGFNHAGVIRSVLRNDYYVQINQKVAPAVIGNWLAELNLQPEWWRYSWNR